MTGWRCGLVAGNAELIERYRGLKANLDSGLFEAVQRAAAVALTDEREFPRQMSEVYARRRDLLVDALAQIGLDVEPPRATPYFWVRVPEGTSSPSPHSCSTRRTSSSRRGPATGPAAKGSCASR